VNLALSCLNLLSVVMKPAHVVASPELQ